MHNNNNLNNNNIIIIGYVWQDLRRKTTSMPVSTGFENLSSMSQNNFFFVFVFLLIFFFFFFFSVGSYWKGPALTLHDLIMVINYLCLTSTYFNFMLEYKLIKKFFLCCLMWNSSPKRQVMFAWPFLQIDLERNRTAVESLVRLVLKGNCIRKKREKSLPVKVLILWFGFLFGQFKWGYWNSAHIISVIYWLLSDVLIPGLGLRSHRHQKVDMVSCVTFCRCWLLSDLVKALYGSYIQDVSFSPARLCTVSFLGLSQDNDNSHRLFVLPHLARAQGIFKGQQICGFNTFTLEACIPPPH